MVEQNQNTNLLNARVTFLELRQRGQQFVAPPASGPKGEALAFIRAENCPAHFYRYLYEQVGKAHHWLKRRNMNTDKLQAILHDDTTSLYIFYCGGVPAGFTEVHYQYEQDNRQAEIVYFGLIPDYQGLGLSRFFLSEVLKAIWVNDVVKICLQTNSLDSPRALQLYQKCGFEPVATEDVEIEAWL